MFQGKRKAVTFSYDDGVSQDRRLIAIFDKYNLRGTFNLNSGLFGRSGALRLEGTTVSHNRIPREEIRGVYAGHEVAAHTLTHPRLCELPDAEVVREVEEDRLALSDLMGEEVVGMAYPGGGRNYDARVMELIRNHTGIRYARTIVSGGDFRLPDDLLEIRPTICHHNHLDELFALGEKFLADESDEPKLLYVWGHAYELDAHDDWARFEQFCRMISGRSDVFYGTNREVFGL